MEHAAEFAANSDEDDDASADPYADDEDDGAPRELLYVNTGGLEGLETQMGRARAGHLRKLERGSLFGPPYTLWYNGQWDPVEVVEEARRVAASASGLVHTRDAGLWTGSTVLPAFSGPRASFYRT